MGYRLYNEEFLAKTLGDPAIVGAYGCLKNKVSEFLFKSLDYVQSFAMRKKAFIEIIEEKYGKAMKPFLENMYINDIRNQVYKHRE